MAVREMVLTCDNCGFEDDEHLNRDDAREAGWYILLGPERDLGRDGERAYCCKSCLESDL